MDFTRVCKTCKEGKFQPLRNRLSCEFAAVCRAGTFVLHHATTTSNRECSSCDGTLHYQVSSTFLWHKPNFNHNSHLHTCNALAGLLLNRMKSTKVYVKMLGPAEWGKRKKLLQLHQAIANALLVYMAIPLKYAILKFFMLEVDSTIF